MNQFILKFLCGLLLLSSHCNGAPSEQEQIEVMPVESDNSDKILSDFSDPEIIPVESNESVEPYYNYSEPEDNSFEFGEPVITDLRTGGVLEPLFNYSEPESMDLGTYEDDMDALPVGYSSRAQVSSYQCASNPATLHLKAWDYAYFKTPNFDGSGYAPYQKCSWRFQTVSGFRLNVNCYPVMLSPNAMLYVNDGIKEGRKYCQQCSQTMEYRFTSSTYQILIGLYNYNRYKNKGFSCWVQSVPNCNCGEVSSSRIINGVETSRNKYKWAVKLYNYAAKPGSVGNCGGSLISDQYVLTAAHCTVGGSKDPSKIKVWLGAHIVPEQGRQITKTEALEVIDHPGYVSDSVKNDISLIRIPLINFSRTSVVRPICLPEGQSTYFNNYATIAGWGMTSTTGPGSSVLRELTYRVISQQSCDIFTSPITSSQICAQRNGVSTYEGDSGGGLFVRSKGYAEHIGILSFGPGGENVDPTQYPNVYTRTTYYGTWIQKKIKNFGSLTCPPPS